MFVHNTLFLCRIVDGVSDAVLFRINGVCPSVYFRNELKKAAKEPNKAALVEIIHIIVNFAVFSIFVSRGAIFISNFATSSFVATCLMSSLKTTSLIASCTDLSVTQDMLRNTLYSFKLFICFFFIVIIVAQHNRI